MTLTPTTASANEPQVRVAASRTATEHPAHPAGAASLRHNFAWTLVGNVVYAASQWGILVLLAKLATPESLGVFALAYAVTAPIFLFAGLSLRSSQATDSGHFRFGDYLGVRALGMGAALVVTVGMAALLEHDATTRLVILTVGVAKAIEGLSDVHYGVMQRHEQMRPIAVSLVSRGLLSVVAFAAVLAAGGPLLVAVAALALTWLAVLLGARRPRRRADAAPPARPALPGSTGARQRGSSRRACPSGR